MTRVAALLALLLFAFAGAPATATGDGAVSTLRLVVDGARLQGEWQVRLADLDPALRLDADGDGVIAWPELEPRRAEIESQLRSRLTILVDDSAAAPRLAELAYGARAGEPFLLAKLVATAADPIRALAIDYSLFAPGGAAREAELRIVWMGAGTHEASLAPGSGRLTFTRESAAGGAPKFLWEGIRHIWIGLDHVLFLLVLLIPAVFRRTAAGREPVATLREAAIRVFVIVTAFTLAHSITLTAAALGWIELPSRLVESAIAASVFVAAVLNFLPHTAGVRGAWLAGGFGLLHGFGFAGVLGELETAGAPVWSTLLAFNVGVELGQLAIVAAFLPVAYALRHSALYRTGVVYGGSTVAAAVALVWFYGRAF